MPKVTMDLLCFNKEFFVKKYSEAGMKDARGIIGRVTRLYSKMSHAQHSLDRIYREIQHYRFRRKVLSQIQPQTKELKRQQTSYIQMICGSNRHIARLKANMIDFDFEAFLQSLPNINFDIDRDGLKLATDKRKAKSYKKQRSLTAYYKKRGH